MVTKKKPKTVTEAVKRQRLVSAWRKIDAWSSDKRDAKKRCLHHRGHYKCEECGSIVPDKVATTFKTGKRKGQPRKAPNFHIDHIEPVVPTSGWAGWDSFHDRLFVPADKRQGLCSECHAEKTKSENATRRGDVVVPDATLEQIAGDNGIVSLGTGFIREPGSKWRTMFIGECDAEEGGDDE